MHLILPYIYDISLDCQCHILYQTAIINTSNAVSTATYNYMMCNKHLKCIWYCNIQLQCHSYRYQRSDVKLKCTTSVEVVASLVEARCQVSLSGSLWCGTENANI